jgi:probable rRNA maturation factor
MRRKRRDAGPRKRGGAGAIENHQKVIRVRIGPLEEFLRQARKEIGLDKECVAVRLINDGEMTRLNRTYRGKKKSTDVLSFPSEERGRPAGLQRRVKSLGGVFLGDIAISPTVAWRNANSFGRTCEEEICILMLHGILHLLGYDHETDRGEMERVETRLRQRLGLAG